MAFLATLRVSLNPFRKEAIHGSCYPVAPVPPSRTTPAAARPRPTTPLRPPAGPRLGPASPPPGEGVLPRPPLLPPGHAVGLPRSGPRPRPLLPPGRRPLPRLAGQPSLAPLLGRPQRLLQGA